MADLTIQDKDVFKTAEHISEFSALLGEVASNYIYSADTGGFNYLTMNKHRLISMDLSRQPCWLHYNISGIVCEMGALEMKPSSLAGSPFFILFLVEC